MPAPCKACHGSNPVSRRSFLGASLGMGTLAFVGAGTPSELAYADTMSKAKRAGKIFVDYFRNDYTATAIADYAVRARPGAPVALPLEWKELETLKSANQFTIKEVLNRLGSKTPPRRSKENNQRIPLGA